jgi:hypothetical protein
MGQQFLNFFDHENFAGTAIYLISINISIKINLKIGAISGIFFGQSGHTYLTI